MTKNNNSQKTEKAFGVVQIQDSHKAGLGVQTTADSRPTSPPSSSSSQPSQEQGTPSGKK